MEKTKSIKLSDIKMSIESVFRIVDKECFICGNPIEVTSESEDGLVKELKIKGFTMLKSDHYGAIGFWCGCDYSEDMESDLLSSCCGQSVLQADSSGHGKCSGCKENCTSL